MPSIPENGKEGISMSNPNKKTGTKQTYIVSKEAYYSEDHKEILTRAAYVQVSPELYHEYNKMTNAYRNKQYEHGRCKCPKDKWWQCDINCEMCPYHCAGDQTSLDGTRTDQDGGTYTLDKHFGQESLDFEGNVADAAMFSEMLAEMEDVFPDIQKIAALLVSGYAETEIAEKVGIPRTTLRSRLQKLKKLFYARYRAYKDGDEE